MIELAGSAAHVVVDDITAPELNEADTHHLVRVLRLRNGERVSVTDGRGSYRWCQWSDGLLAADEAIQFVARQLPEVGVAFSIVKGDRLDWIVQKLTELGVDRLVPMAADRCVVQWDEAKARAQVERMRRIAHEASMQSRRVWLPEVEALAAADEVLQRPEVARADVEGARAPIEPVDGATMIAIGPEGGWTARERNLSPRTVTLGSTVLRAETAAIAAGVLLVDRRRQRSVSES